MATIFGPSAPSPGAGGASIFSPGAFTGGQPVGPGSTFNISGAPIAILGGVFTNGLPLGGPVTQVFRSGGPQPFTLFLSTLLSSGPIGPFLLGAAGAELQFGPSTIYFIAPGGGPPSIAPAIGASLIF